MTPEADRSGEPNMIPCYQAIGHDADCGCEHCLHVMPGERAACDHLYIQTMTEERDALRAQVAALEAARDVVFGSHPNDMATRAAFEAAVARALTVP